MRIGRHRLGEREINAIRNTLRHVHDIGPDKSVQPPAGTRTIYASGVRTPSEIGHWLNPAQSGEDLSPFDALKDTLALLRAPNVQTPIVIVENVPVDRSATASLFLIASLLGEIREYVGHGAPVIEVSDKARIVGGRPSSDNNLEFKLHTDMSFYPAPPEFVCFLLLSHGALGGETTFCDARAVLPLLSRPTLAALQRDFRFPAPPHRLDLGPQLFPILTLGAAGSVGVRYRRDGLEALDSIQERALRDWENEVDGRALEVALSPGDMVIYSNAALLHGRREFQDDPKNRKIRSALRAYVTPAPC